ncbi:ornithine cyclodeaminase [Veronia nyctiphanis]|uniref:Ornithine cyclodeaminase n=1 Tax=Veronia nyctiphanis TaxID=1278244 RepID=A0A4Q0YL52_9GAMM|nr:ornithine cyclodeaminase family protein [Veronia nyctiphanis]RXJ71143.1 ornithine cyclodeaminase [Veronia nyctiphanis]
MSAGEGSLTFTIGAELATSQSIGFRVYDTYPNRNGTDTDQTVAVYSSVESKLKGLIVGSRLGVIRTAAINGYAMSMMSSEQAETICLIGAGHHAYYQLKAALTVRNPKKVILFNRTQEKANTLRDRIIREYKNKFDCVVIDEVEEGVKTADIIICATSSPKPILDASWIKDGAYLSSIGPKFADRHELPKNIRQRASVIVTDALDQLQSYSKPHFLGDTSDVVSLETFDAPNNPTGYHVFLSSGRSGTEVVVGDRIIDYLNHQQ